jgi:hypothetical protein
MKRSVLFFIASISLTLAGCHPESEDVPVQTASSIIVKASNPEEGVVTKAEATGIIVFTGDDIQWFNETTKELCFKNNISNNPGNNPLLYATPAIRFYINDEYLFSSMIYVSDISSQSYNKLVFYYSIIENKYFLADGYPTDMSGFREPQKAQEERDENMRRIADEWNKFIDQMKKEGRYKN